MDSIKRERTIARHNRELRRLIDFEMAHALPQALKVASQKRQAELRELLKNLKAGR
jgi:hypothetical protein